MSINRYAARVDGPQAEIVAALRKMGVKVWVIKQPVDLLTRWAGLWLPLEIKRDKKAKFSSTKQEKFCKDHDVPVVTNAAEAIEAVCGYQVGKYRSIK